jgi:predicted oxidoreductase
MAKEMGGNVAGQLTNEQLQQAADLTTELKELLDRAPAVDGYEPIKALLPDLEKSIEDGTLEDLVLSLLQDTVNNLREAETAQRELEATIAEGKVVIE